MFCYMISCGTINVSYEFRHFNNNFKFSNFTEFKVKAAIKNIGHYCWRIKAFFEVDASCGAKRGVQRKPNLLSAQTSTKDRLHSIFK